MQYCTMGKLGWQVSEIGYGMWGIAGGPGGFGSGADYELAPRCLDEAIALGCNFFDTAGHTAEGSANYCSGRRCAGIAARNYTWPRRSRPRTGCGRQDPMTDDSLDDVYPTAHINDCVRRSLDNLGTESIDLLQFHVWEDR